MNKKIYRKIIVIAISVLCIAILMTYVHMNKDDSLIRHQESGSIRIGYAVEAPYAFLKPGGEVTGESPEVARRIAEKIGIRRIEWIQTEFGSLISGLLSDRFDVIAAGMFITPDRAKRVDFSEPTFHVRQGLLVRKGNPHHLISYQQAATRENIRLAVIIGAVEEKIVRESGMTEPRIITVPDARAGLAAVESGLADGLALSFLTIKQMQIKQTIGNTEAAAPFIQPDTISAKGLGFGAFAFRKNDSELKSAWNKKLKQYIGSPDHRRLISEFGFTDDDLPGNMTTKEILAK